MGNCGLRPMKTRPKLYPAQALKDFVDYVILRRHYEEVGPKGLSPLMV